MKKDIKLMLRAYFSAMGKKSAETRLAKLGVDGFNAYMKKIRMKNRKKVINR